MKPTVQKISAVQGDVFYSVFNKTDYHDTICEILSSAVNEKIKYENIPINELGRPDFSSWGLDVNWTHSHKFCVLAYSFTARVGVDLEFHKKRPIKLANRFFHSEEIQAIHDLGDPLLSEQLFFQLWCRKEALFKCFGGSFFKDVLPRSVLSEESSHFSFYEPSLGELEENSPYSFCIVVSKKE